MSIFIADPTVQLASLPAAGLPVLLQHVALITKRPMCVTDQLLCRPLHCCCCCCCSAWPSCCCSAAGCCVMRRCGCRRWCHTCSHSWRTPTQASGGYTVGSAEPLQLAHAVTKAKALTDSKKTEVLGGAAAGFKHAMHMMRCSCCSCQPTLNRGYPSVRCVAHVCLVLS